MSNGYDPNALQQMAEDAPEAGFSALNFGRLEVTPYIVSWTGAKGEKRVKQERVMAPGEKLGQGEVLELGFRVLISELNPSLEFEYERRVPMRKSRANPRQPSDKTDWSEIVEPALIKVLGKNYFAHLLKSPYVCVEDIPNTQGKASESGKIYGVPKLVKVYANVAECVAAREATYGGAKAGGASEAVDAIGVNGVPVSVAKAFKGLKAALGGADEATVMQMVKAEPSMAAFTLEQLEAAAATQ